MRTEFVGPERMDLGFGMICSLLYNIHRSSNSRPLGPYDFMPFRQAREEPESTPEEFARAFNAEVMG